MNYIEAIQGNEVLLVCRDLQAEAGVKALGAKRDFGWGRWAIPYGSRHELAAVLSGLQALGFLFADQPHGWPPAAVFDQLRDEGLMKGKVKRVAWKGPDDPAVSEG